MESKKEPGKVADAIERISDYTDVNMLLAVHFILSKFDQKAFIDMTTRKPLDVIKKAFRSIEKMLGLKSAQDAAQKDVFTQNVDALLGDSSKKEHTLDDIYHRNRGKAKLLMDFLDENFKEAGADIEPHTPVDYKKAPELLDRLNNKEVLEVAKALNVKWKELSRKAVKLGSGEASTLLEIPHPFIIPGGRFRECYYWDTYWVLDGLLVCGMDRSAENVIRNFIHTIKTYGYIPSGLRKYYLYRTHPPYFTMMLLRLYKSGMHNELVLGEGLCMATEEYKFFEANRHVSVKGRDGDSHRLGIYRVKTDFPKPGSFGRDILTYKNQDVMSEEMVYSNLKSATESGWDFSSRWFLDPADIKTISTYNQIPVDLNAILYRNEKVLEMLWSARGDSEKAEEFRKNAAAREKAINQVLWNSEEGVWQDYNLATEKHVSRGFYFSNIEPMIYGVSIPDGGISAYDILWKYKMELFGYPGGIPASGAGEPTNQQWDFPNAWAPHSHMLFYYLLGMEEREMALHVGRSFFRSVHEGYKKVKDFHEKYDCRDPGLTGGGGHYVPQMGFGWTNGAALAFIHEFGDEIIGGPGHAESYKKVLEVLDMRRHA